MMPGLDQVALRYPDPITVSDFAHELGVWVASLTRHYRSRRSCAPGYAVID